MMGDDESEAPVSKHRAWEFGFKHVFVGVR